MATLVVQTVTPAGITPTLNTPSASDVFANDGNIMLRYVNGNASTLNVAVVTQQVVGSTSLAVADLPLVLTTGTNGCIGPFNKAIYNDSSGNVTITHDVTSSVTVELFKVNPAG